MDGSVERVGRPNGSGNQEDGRAFALDLVDTTDPFKEFTQRPSEGAPLQFPGKSLAAKFPRFSLA